MPTYEYACRKCGHAFEIFQSMKAATLKKCPECQKLALKRLVGGGGGLIFKGTGFYITDYKNAPAKKGGDKAAGGGEKAATAGGGEKPASKGGDAKPAASTAAK